MLARCVNAERAKPSPAAGAKLLALAACPWLWGCSCILQEGAVGEHERFALALCICALHERFAQALCTSTRSPLAPPRAWAALPVLLAELPSSHGVLGTLRGQGPARRVGSWGRVPCLRPEPWHGARIRALGARGVLRLLRLEQRMQMLITRVGAAFRGVFPRQLEIQKTTNVTGACPSETSSPSAQAHAVGLFSLSERASEQPLLPPAWLSERAIASLKAGKPSPASSHASRFAFVPGIVPPPPRLTWRGAMPEKLQKQSVNCQQRQKWQRFDASFK